MAEKSVTVRVRIGDAECEVTGPRPFVEKEIEKFIKNRKEAARRKDNPNANKNLQR